MLVKARSVRTISENTLKARYPEVVNQVNQKILAAANEGYTEILFECSSVMVNILRHDLRDAGYEAESLSYRDLPRTGLTICWGVSAPGDAL